MMEHKSSISELNPCDIKQNTATRKPHNPRKCRSNTKSKAAAGHDQDFVQSTIDSTPSTLSVNAIQSTFPNDISDEDLRRYFSKFEKYILRAVILRSRRGRYGLITFSSYEIAETARKAFRGQRLLGCLTRLGHYEVQTKKEYHATQKDANQPEVASFAPSFTDPHVSASCCDGKQGSTKILLEENHAASPRDQPKSGLCVKGIHSKLPEEISDEELMKHFSAFSNDIISAFIARDPQTKLSTGYGIIIFKSSETAMKAQKKYNGTHLCRKYQLRITLENPDSLFSLTRSTIPAAKSVEDNIRVSGYNNGENLSLSQNSGAIFNVFPAHAKKKSQRSDDCTVSTASKVDALDSKGIKPLKTGKTETSDFAAGKLIVENLSCLVEENELKALINICGAEVSSCTILRNSVARGTCTANVTLVDSSLVEGVIKQLNEREAYSYKLRVYSTKKEYGEPRLHVEKRTISLQLYHFISKHSHAEIEIFMHEGGTFEYQELEGSVLLSAPSESVAINFLLQVFNKYTEKTIAFKPTKWNQLTLKHVPSILSRTKLKVSVETDVDIIPQMDKQEILFFGTHEGVRRTSSWLMYQLSREIEIASDKMEALTAIFPTLDSELCDRHHIKVLNYSQHSSEIILDGDAENIQDAHQEIEALISKFCFAEVCFEHPTRLLESAQKRLRESELKVYIKTPSGAERSKPICLTISSFFPKQLEKATAILKGCPIYKSLKLSGDFNIDPMKLKRLEAGIREECQVSIRRIYKQKVITTLLISGFVKNDVGAAHKKLREQIFSCCTTESSKHKAASQDVKDSELRTSGKFHRPHMEPCLHKPVETSTKHYISVRREFHVKSCCRALVTLSTEMTYYVQNQADWFTKITKNCISVIVPEKTNLTSAKIPCPGHTYTFEGKIDIIDNLVEEIKSLAEVFCIKVVSLSLPTENVRLMQSRWAQFKVDNEAIQHSICIDFTLVSPKLNSTSKEKESTVTFTVCGNNSEQIAKVVQQLKLNESGLNLPVQETTLSADQLMVLNSLVANQQINFDECAVIMRILPETKSLILKAASKDGLNLAYRHILTLIESSISSHAKEVVSLKHESSEHSQSVASSQPTSVKCCTLSFESHYIPLIFSHNFVEIASQFEKGRGVRVIPISEYLIDSTVKQVIYKSSSGHLITVQLCYSNLVYEKVDAIVNYSRKLSHSMKAIGGEALQLELDNHIAYYQEEADSDICTCLESGNLPCSKIIHVISPLQDTTGPRNFSIIQRALECAQKQKIRQISLPSVSSDAVSAENVVYNLQTFFIENPDSCVHLVRIVCSSEKSVNVYSSIKEFDSDGTTVDLPKLTAIKPALIVSAEHTKCQWYWQADDGTFIPYSKDINETLVCDHKRCPTGRCYFQIGSNSYVANFERMEQSNMTTCFVRKMKLEHINQNISDTCHAKSGLKVSVKWFYHTQDKKCTPYSAAYSASIEKLYFSSTESPTLQVNSKKFLFDFGAMQKQALPYDITHIQRKVIVQQLEKSHSHSTPQWYYMDDTKQFSPYSKQNSADIEGMYQTQAIRTLSIQSKVYKFDFNDMKQINVATGYKRSIKREFKSSVDAQNQSQLIPLHHICKSIVIGLEGTSEYLQEISEEFKVKVSGMVHTNELPLPVPITSSVDSKARILRVAEKYNVQSEIVSKPIDVDSKVLKVSGEESIVGNAIKGVMEEILLCNQSGMATTIQMPPEWQPQTKNTELFELVKSSNEYLHVESMFHSTMSKTSTAIISIKRIQNNWLWEKYVVTRNRMSRKNNGRINEKELFHGSRNCRAHTIYDSEEGLDMRYSSEGMWGQANYFAEKASYSNSYAYELTDDNREILLAKVLTGESCKCASDRSLRLPPLKGSQTRFQQERYDTVEGETGGSKVYMTYTNDKAYPAYLIVYNPKTAWGSSMKQTAAAPTSTSAASWSYNLNPTASAQSAPTSVRAAPPIVNPRPSYQGRPHRQAPQPTPKVSHPPSSEQKGCILQ